MRRNIIIIRADKHERNDLTCTNRGCVTLSPESYKCHQSVAIVLAVYIWMATMEVHSEALPKPYFKTVNFSPASIFFSIYKLFPGLKNH